MRSDRQNQVMAAQSELGELVALISLGDREEQQDAYGYELNDHECFAVVCDGMGGYESGEIASRKALELILDSCQKYGSDTPAPEWMSRAVVEADELVLRLANELKDNQKMGTTASQVLIRDGQMYWNSVGDSRVYICRGDQFVQVTTDHNYSTVLKEKHEAGLISREYFNDEQKYGELLVNYIGIGAVNLMSRNTEPLTLQKGDIVVLTSDGLYRVLDDAAIMREIKKEESLKDRAESLEALTAQTAVEKGIRRDNMTVVLFEIG